MSLLTDNLVMRSLCILACGIWAPTALAHSQAEVLNTGVIYGTVIAQDVMLQLGELRGRLHGALSGQTPEAAFSPAGRVTEHTDILGSTG